MSAKELEVNQLKSNIDGLQSDLLAQDHRVEQLQSSLNTLQSEYDIKLKEMDDIESERQTVVEQYTQLMDKKSISKTDSEVFSQYSVSESLEYNPKVWKIYVLTFIDLYIMLLFEGEKDSPALWGYHGSYSTSPDAYQVWSRR